MTAVKLYALAENNGNSFSIRVFNRVTRERFAVKERGESEPHQERFPYAVVYSVFTCVSGIPTKTTEMAYCPDYNSASKVAQELAKARFDEDYKPFSEI